MSFKYKDQAIDKMDNDIYSTDEERIGTWIDGKPLYRKVLSTTTPTTVNTTQNRVTFESKLDMCIISGFFYDANASSLPLNAIDPNGNYSLFTYYYKPSNSITMRTSHSSWINRSAIIIAEYTKTSDKAGD